MVNGFSAKRVSTASAAVAAFMRVDNASSCVARVATSTLNFNLVTFLQFGSTPALFVQLR